MSSLLLYGSETWKVTNVGEVQDCIIVEKSRNLKEEWKEVKAKLCSGISNIA